MVKPPKYISKETLFPDLDGKYTNSTVTNTNPKINTKQSSVIENSKQSSKISKHSHRTKLRHENFNKISNGYLEDWNSHPISHPSQNIHNQIPNIKDNFKEIIIKEKSEQITSDTNIPHEKNKEKNKEKNNSKHILQSDINKDEDKTEQITSNINKDEDKTKQITSNINKDEDKTKQITSNINIVDEKKKDNEKFVLQCENCHKQSAVLCSNCQNDEFKAGILDHKNDFNLVSIILSTDKNLILNTENEYELQFNMGMLEGYGISVNSHGNIITFQDEGSYRFEISGEGILFSDVEVKLVYHSDKFTNDIKSFSEITVPKDNSKLLLRGIPTILPLQKEHSIIVKLIPNPSESILLSAGTRLLIHRVA